VDPDCAETTTRCGTRAAVRWLSSHTAGDRQLRLAEARVLVDMLHDVARHNQVATIRLERRLPSQRLWVGAGRVA
jgi:hypothetical protein